MTWVYAYLTAGVVTLALMIADHFRKRRRPSAFVLEVMESLEPERKTLRYRFMNNVVGPVVGAWLVILGWPLALGLYGDGWHSRRRRQELEDLKFQVLREDLKEKLTVQEIEQRERVFDPLGAVPDLPFGHLHAPWKKLVSGVGPSDEVWTFSADGYEEPGWGTGETRAGYVVVSKGVPGDFIVLSRKKIYGLNRRRPTRPGRKRDPLEAVEIPEFLRKHAD